MKVVTTVLPYSRLSHQTGPMSYTTVSGDERHTEELPVAMSTSTFMTVVGMLGILLSMFMGSISLGREGKHLDTRYFFLISITMFVIGILTSLTPISTEGGAAK